MLINTQATWNAACADIAARYGVTLSADDRHALIGLALQPLARALAELLGHPAQADQLSEQVHAAVCANLNKSLPVMPGTHDLVNALKGNRLLAVASNAPRETVTHYLDSAGILDAFDVVVGSDQVHQPKPAPDVYLAACQGLGRRPSACVAVEDSTAGAHAALAAGLYVIAIPSAPDVAVPAHQHASGLDDPRLWELLGITRWRATPS